MLMANHKVKEYYAAEIDKHANKLSSFLFPDIKMLGDVTKWKEWDIDWNFDIVLSGSPCQDLSLAGKRKGLMGGERSVLFFVFVDILNHIRTINPNVLFLQENVASATKSDVGIMSRTMGVYPVRINASLVSAQSRDRYYWSNIKTVKVGLFGDVLTDIPQPKDRGILLKHILEENVEEKYYLSDAQLRRIIDKKPLINPDKSYVVVANNNTSAFGNDRSATLVNGYIKLDINLNPKSNQKKASCFTAGAHSGGNHSDMDLIREVIQLNPSTESGGKQPYQQNRVYDTDGLAPALCEGKSDLLITECWDISKGVGMVNKSRIRRFTPIECFRLQSIPEHIIDRIMESGTSDTQMYKMAGNGWNCEVIKWIFSFI